MSDQVRSSRSFGFPFRVPRRYWVVAGVVVVVLLIALGGRRAWRQHLIRAELRRMTATGEPTSAADLYAMYRPGPEENHATRDWLAAIAALKQVWSYDNDLKGLFIDEEVASAPPDQPWPHQARVATLLRGKYAEAMRLIHIAAAQPGPAFFAVEFSEGGEAGLPHVEKVRDAVLLLALEAHLLARESDDASVIETLLVLFSAADSLQREPLLVSQMVRLRRARTAVRELAWLLPTLDVDDGDLQRLQAALRKPSYEEGMRRALLGERVLGLMAFDDPRTVGSANAADTWLWRLRNEKDRLLYLEVMRDLIAVCDLPLPEAVQRSQEIARRVTMPANARPVPSRWWPFRSASTAWGAQQWFGSVSLSIEKPWRPARRGFVRRMRWSPSSATAAGAVACRSGCKS